MSKTILSSTLTSEARFQKENTLSSLPLTLKVLHRSFMFFRLLPSIKGTQVLALACLRVFLAGVQPVLPGLQFSNHRMVLMSNVAEQDLFPLHLDSFSRRERG